MTFGSPEFMWICFLAGVDKVVSSSSPPSFLLTRHGGIFGQLMAEYVVAQMVNWERRLYNTYDDQKKQKWWVELGGEIMYTALHLWEGDDDLLEQFTCQPT